jgi:hypothetical protein
MAGIVVMGAGMLGLSAAFTLARRGARVTVIERAHPGAGASGGLVGALAPHVPEGWNAKKATSIRKPADGRGLLGRGCAQSAGATRAMRAWDGCSRSPTTPRGARAGTRAQARDLWQGRAAWRVLPAPMCRGFRAASPTGLVVHDTLSARIAPRRAWPRWSRRWRHGSWRYARARAPPGCRCRDLGDGTGRAGDLGARFGRADGGRGQGTGGASGGRLARRAAGLWRRAACRAACRWNGGHRLDIGTGLRRRRARRMRSSTR